MTNPLLQHAPLPTFSAIKPEHVEPAIDIILTESREQLTALLEQPGEATWDSLVEPLALMNNRLSRAWSPVSHLNGVMNSEALREAHTACLAKLSEYYTELGQNEKLFAAYKSIAANPEALTPSQRKVIDNALRDFRLSGVALSPQHKARFKALSQELSALSSDFSNKVLDATHAWHKHLESAAALAGLPQSAVDLARQNAQQRGLEGYVLTLDFPSYLPVMTYANDAALREEVYRAFSTRASDQGPNAGEFDNADNMRRILAVRQEQAALLGYANYAELSLASKMAGATAEVMDFLNDLAHKSHHQARREYEELQLYAREHHDHDVLQAWDIAYFSEKLREHRFRISEEEVKPYFSVDRVIDGMFEVVGRLFGVTFERTDGVDVYHPDVSFYEIRDPDGELRAQFYFDLYARAKKRGGAWMDTCQSRMRSSGGIQIPVAYMVCNFTPPVNGKPSLLTHREVETLFHEFGHGLHHMLTRVDEYDVSGINGVAWDAVELPSQFMENYCWEREALDLFAAHVDTGERIPEDLYQRMLAAKNFQSGMMMVRQLEFALFDFRMHLEYDGQESDFIERILAEVREQVAVVRAPEWNRFPHAFTHVFGGGYAAGYYSYKWAEVLSADVFARFEEEGVFNAQTGRDFLHSILERGGSQDAAVLFREFRGRDPEVDALLRHTGIAA